MEGVEDALGPVAADDVGEGEEGTPVVAEAVVGRGRHDGVAGGDGGEVVLSPAGDLTAQEVFDFDVALVEACLKGPGWSFDQVNDNGAVAEGRGEGAQTGQGGGGEDLKGADSATFAPVNAGAGAVASIDEAAQFGVEAEVGVQFVQQDGGSGGSLAVDDAEHDGRFHVIGAEDLGNQGGREVEGGGFATARFAGGEVEARGVAKGADGRGVSRPEGEDDVGAGRQV